MEDKIKLIAGTANSELAKEISSYLNTALTPITIKKFNDGETYCKIEKSVRGSHVFIIQSTSPPVNENLMELLVIVDAAKRASAKEITAVIPYYGYGRQDRKAEPREPITAKLVANLITKAGVDRVVTFDLHVDQIQGFFDIPLDNLEVMPLMVEYILDKKLKNIVVVAPDAGGTKRARRFAKLLNSSLAIIDKRRPEHGVAEVLNIIGDVKGKNAILVDDIIDTAGTIAESAKTLIKEGVKSVYVCATHPVFSGQAVERLNDKSVEEVIITNTIFIPSNKIISKMKVISLAPLLAESIKRIYDGSPMGIIFDGLYDKISKKRQE